MTVRRSSLMMINVVHGQPERRVVSIDCRKDNTSQSLEPIVILATAAMKKTTTTKTMVLPTTLTYCQFAVNLAMMMVFQPDDIVVVVNAAPSSCPNDASVQGYSNKTVLNQDLQNNAGGTGTYTICPGTTFLFTEDDPNIVDVFGSNAVTIQCGADGSSSNNCIFELTGNTADPLMSIFADNTIIQGLTFSSSVDFSNSVCDVYNSTIFRDCHFQNFQSTENTPFITIDVLSSNDEPPGRRSVTFDGCTFRNNAISSIPRLISVSGDSDHTYDLTVQNTVFEKTSAGLSIIGVDESSGSITVTDTVFRCDDKFSALSVIDANGASVTVQSSCFVEMNVENTYVSTFKDSSTGDNQNSATDTSYVRPLNSNTECNGIQVLLVGDDTNPPPTQCVAFTAADSCPVAGQDSSPCPTPEPTTAPSETPPPEPSSAELKTANGLAILISFVLLLLSTTVSVACFDR